MNNTRPTVHLTGDAPPCSPEDRISALRRIADAGPIEVDEYGLGGVVAKAERYFADKLGKEAAIICPTGTLANHLAIRAHCRNRRAQRVVVQAESHVHRDSGGALPQLSSFAEIALGHGTATFKATELKGALDRLESEKVTSSIGCVSLESPVRRFANQCIPPAELDQILALCRDHGLPVHLDGARTWLDCHCKGIPVATHAARFDTVYVSLYKYFGAPSVAALPGVTATGPEITRYRCKQAEGREH